MRSSDDPAADVFTRVTALAADTAELRERESVELQSLALALSDFARQHTLGERPPAAALSLRARMQARFRLGGTPVHLGQGLFLAPDGTLLVADLSAPDRARREIIVTAIAAFVAGLLLNGVVAAVAVLGVILWTLLSLLWKGVGGVVYGFSRVAPEDEHAALVTLRRMLDSLERDVRDSARLLPD